MSIYIETYNKERKVIEIPVRDPDRYIIYVNKKIL